MNVDINPEYADSLDDMTFSVHLLFEPADDTALNKLENREFANSYQLRGKEAFESGLDEVYNNSNTYIMLCYVMFYMTKKHTLLTSFCQPYSYILCSDFQVSLRGARWKYVRSIG